MTEFRGVTGDPDHDVQSGGTGLYEFRTDTRVPVYLHDTAFEVLTYRPGPTPTLRLQFRYDDPEWTPPEAADTPVVEMIFDQVRIGRWVEDHDAFSVPEDALGQVHLFDYDGADGFVLNTLTTELTFSAETATICLLPLGDDRRYSEREA